MPVNPINLVAILLPVFFACGERPLIPKNYSDSLEAKNNLFAFVGKKISFEQLPYEKGSMDNGFRATYKILQRVYGEYPDDVITFEAYDHYGVPAFEQYENVLLYVVKVDDKFYHEKYQFSAVFPTKEGRWAGVYSPDYEDLDSLTVKPEPIQFAKPVKFATSRYFFNGMIHCAEKSFPQPFYYIDNDTATAIYGNYVEELFQLKKEGILRARGLFGDSLIYEEPVIVQDVTLEEVPEKVNIRTDGRFISFAKKFLEKLTDQDTIFVGRHMFDTLIICGRTVNQETFLHERRERIWDKRFMEEVIPGGIINYQTFPITDYSRDKNINSVATQPRVMQLFLCSSRKGLIHYSITFNFVETADGYKLFRLEDEGNRACSGEEYDPYEDFT